MQCLIVAPFNIATLRLGGIVWLSLGGFAFKEMVCWFNQKPSPLCWVFSCSRKEKQQWGSRSFRLRVSGQTLFFKPPLLMFYSLASSLEICQRRQQLQQQQTSNNLLRLFVAWMKVCTTRRLIDWKAAQTRFRPIKSLQLLTATIAALSQTPPCWSACDPLVKEAGLSSSALWDENLQSHRRKLSFAVSQNLLEFFAANFADEPHLSLRFEEFVHCVWLFSDSLGSAFTLPNPSPSEPELLKAWTCSNCR